MTFCVSSETENAFATRILALESSSVVAQAQERFRENIGGGGSSWNDVMVVAGCCMGIVL